LRPSPRCHTWQLAAATAPSGARACDCSSSYSRMAALQQCADAEIALILFVLLVWMAG
jgi:hypothetical protein